MKPSAGGVSSPTVDLESMHCFVVAAELLSFRAAAEAVALSPAAFSDRIRRLEEGLGARLFHRTTRRVQLTEAGARLLPQAQKCLVAAEACRDAVLLDDQPMSCELTIGTRFELGMSWLVPALSTIEKSHPHLNLHLVFGDSDDLLDRLKRDRIDAFVSSARITTVGLKYARLHEEQYAFVSKPSRLAKSPITRPSHCAAHTLLELHPDLPLFRYFMDARPAGEVWAFSRIQFLGTIGAVRARVLEGAGVAVLPRYFVEPSLTNGKLTPVMPNTRLPVDWFRLIWKSGHPREHALHEVAQVLERLPLR